MNLHLKVWRQKNKSSQGRFVSYEAKDISTDTSFLEMLDVVNEELIKKGEEPIAFDHDCREGICGSCGMYINGRADRTAFDRIMVAGGFISVNTGGAPDANALPISKEEQESAMDAAACIGCGACVAACKNASAMLFVSAKVAHLARLPQGKPEREKRVMAMVAQMEEEGFGACTNTEACSAECPKEIPMDVIATLRREYMRAFVKSEEKV
jgi:succinate dehydrogenase / fumarate reductase iron-sulfur subunit